MLYQLYVLFYNFIIVDNIGYFNAYYKHQKSYSICVKLSERIESYLNYNTNIKVAIIGNLDENKYKSTNLTAKITNEITGTNGENSLYVQDDYQSMLKHYFGILIEIATEEEINDIIKGEEFQSMSTYPDENSIKIINDILVVKLSEK